MVYWSLLRTIQMAMGHLYYLNFPHFFCICQFEFSAFWKDRKSAGNSIYQILILLEISPFLTFFMLFKAWTVLRQKKFPFHSGLYGRKKAGEKSRELCTMSKGAFVHIQSPPTSAAQKVQTKAFIFHHQRFANAVIIETEASLWPAKPEAETAI